MKNFSRNHCSFAAAKQTHRAINSIDKNWKNSLNDFFFFRFENYSSNDNSFFFRSSRKISNKNSVLQNFFFFFPLSFFERSKFIWHFFNFVKNSRLLLFFEIFLILLMIVFSNFLFFYFFMTIFRIFFQKNRSKNSQKMSNHYENSVVKTKNNFNKNQSKTEIEENQNVQKIVKRTNSISKKKKQSTNLITFFKSLNLSAKRKNFSSISVFLSMKILNIIFQNVDLKSSSFRVQVKISSKRQNRQTSFFKKRQSIQTDEDYLRELQRQKKNKRIQTINKFKKRFQIKQISKRQKNHTTKRRIKLTSW